MLSPHTDQLTAVLWNKCVVGLAKVSKDGDWLDVNEKICEILEYTQAELLKKTFQDVTHPADVNDDVSMVNMVINGKIDHYVMSKRYITKTGKVIWIKLRVDPIKTPTGEVEYFLSQIDPARSVQAMPEPETKLKEVRLGWKGFIEENWKWLIVTAVALGGWALDRYSEYQYMKNTQKEVLKRLNELELTEESK